MPKILIKLQTATYYGFIKIDLGMLLKSDLLFKVTAETVYNSRIFTHLLVSLPLYLCLPVSSVASVLLPQPLPDLWNSLAEIRNNTLKVE